MPDPNDLLLFGLLLMGIGLIAWLEHVYDRWGQP